MSEQPARRLRISHVVIQPVLVWDDGEELAPGPQAQPTSLPLSALAGLADGLRAEVAQMQARDDAQADDA